MRLIQKAFAPLIGVAVLTGCSQEVQEKAEVARPVKIITVSKGAAIASRTYPGKAYATESAKLSFRISGPLHKFPVKSGQRVKQGELLAQIDPRDYATNLQKVEASINQINAQLTAADKEFARQKTLLKSNATSQALFDTAKSKYGSLIANRSNLNAQKKAASDALQDTNLTAPFDGIIAETYVKNFEEVRPKQQIILLQDISKIDIKVEVPEHLMVFKRGEVAKDSHIEAEFTSLPGKFFKLTVKEMTTEADPTTNTYSVTGTMVAPSDVELKSGMTCNVVHTSPMYGKASSIIVPTNAVFNDENGTPNVWIVSEAMRLSKRKVEVGEMAKDGLTIKSGLIIGDKIISAGVHYAFENMLVKQQQNK